MSESKGIHKAVLAVMREIGAIGKAHDNDQQNYKFRGIEDIYNRVQPLFIRHGIYSVPKVLTTERREGKTKAGGVMNYCMLTVEYTFFAEDGSHVQAVVVGEGMDTGDKASSKALSMADKYAISQLLKIPYAMVDPDQFSPQWEPDSITKGEWNEIKSQWWSKHRKKLDGIERSECMEAFEKWACKHAGRDFSALNWREWRTEDRRACLDALNPPGAVTSDPEKLADETKKQLDKELAESKGK